MWIGLRDLVDGVLRIYPNAIRVLLDFKLVNAGCSPVAGSCRASAGACVRHRSSGRALLKALHYAERGR